MSPAPLGFVGLGVMGAPMCANLHAKSGRPVLAYDIDAAALNRATSQGIGAAGDLVELAQQAEVIFLSLPGGEQLAQVVGDLMPHLRRGQVIVDTTTAPVGLTRQLAGLLGDEGVDYADAPIARTRQAARDGTLSVMVGATAAVFARIEPLIVCYATDISHCGPVGSGQVVKILNNMVLVETVSALAEALTIGRRAGVDGAVLLETLSKGSADSFALRNHATKAMLPGRFPVRAFSARYAVKDLDYALELAAETAVSADGARLGRARLEAAIAKGLDQAYWPVLLAAVDETLDAETPEED